MKLASDNHIQALPTLPVPSTENLNLSRLWAMRLVRGMNSICPFLTANGFEDRDSASYLGYDITREDEYLEEHSHFVKDFNCLVDKLDVDELTLDVPKSLRTNVELLAKALGLKPNEQRILILAIMMVTDQDLYNVVSAYAPLSNSKVLRVFSSCLDLSFEQMKGYFRRTSTLKRCGLLRFDSSMDFDIVSKLDFISPSFPHDMVREPAKVEELFGEVIRTPPEPYLMPVDFEHCAEFYQITKQFIQSQLDQESTRGNILLYGDTGTGKTELTRTLANELSASIYEISFMDYDGNPIDASKRLRAMFLAKEMLSKDRSVLVFDEIEDVFNDGSMLGKRSTAQGHKAWMNNILESNSVPTIWISNDISMMDPAFIRRFDIVFELPNPSKAKRFDMFQKINGGFLNEQTVRDISEIEELSPALFTNTLQVVQRMGDQIDADQAFKALVASSIKTQGGNTRRLNRESNRSIYSESYLNVDFEPGQVVSALQDKPAGRLCFYGPSGTGKTAFAHWLAEQLDMPIISKKVSDLMDSYVGKTEANIANAFTEASRDGAILLLDEADSFLADRRGARNSWEVTLVNELLTQLESFSGIFIATSNLMDNIDQAALRRFDLKVYFDYLTPADLKTVYCQYSEQLNLEAPVDNDLTALEGLNQVTLGDFATIVQKSRFKPIKSHNDFIEALRDELGIRFVGMAKIGFA